MAPRVTERPAARALAGWGLAMLLVLAPMAPRVPLPLLAGLASVALLAFALVAGVRRYALRRALLDQPGQRRSHVLPTPRGGGAAIALLLAVAAGLLAWLADGREAHALAAFALGVVLVGTVGAMDDHRPLSARARLLVHLLAAAGVVLALWGPPATPVGAGIALLALLWIAGLTNAWNFMDGINGLAAGQGVVVGLALLWLLAPTPWALLAGVLAAGCLGFLPWNLPRARIFLGDVGSGVLGFAAACLLLLAWDRGALGLPGVLLLASGIGVDAGLTLARRVLGRRRWWQGHREHLYQWLVRSGHPHARVAAGYAAWSLAMALLVPVLVADATPRAYAVALGLLAAASLGWWTWRRRLLSRRRAASRSRRAGRSGRKEQGMDEAQA
jgi:UDP-N-acetylmuramyl pentapeptide phosphotransferase/UDP-N-acetylglucosamine-1-phosphate transferase